MNNNDKQIISTGSCSLYITGIVTAALVSLHPAHANEYTTTYSSHSKLAAEQLQDQFGPSSYLTNSTISFDQSPRFEQLISFAKNFMESQQDLDQESRQVLEDSFWDLV